MDHLSTASSGDDSPSTESTIIAPCGPDHTHTVIFLHGREDFGEDLAKYFFDSKSSSDESMADLFPSVRWVFPTAKLRYSAQRDFEFSSSCFAEALKGEEIISQWFDVWDIKTPEEKKELMIPGLGESILDIIQIVKEEAEIIPLDRLILGGISQGCATAILTLIASDINLGGFIGLCSWLSFQKEIESMTTCTDKKCSISASVKELLQFPPMDNSEGRCEKPAEGTARAATADGIDAAGAALERLSIQPHYTTPMFFAHSLDDQTVPFQLGQRLCQTVDQLGFIVNAKEYENGGHWIHSKQGVDDMSSFLRQIIG